MIEQYAIRIRTGRAVGTGVMEKLRNGNMREKKVYMEEYLTRGAGTLQPKEWKKKVLEAAEADGLLDILDALKEYVGGHMAWLHTPKEVEAYSLEVLADGAYLHWKDFKCPGRCEFRFEEGSEDDSGND